jgi:hypothetical protein
MALTGDHDMVITAKRFNTTKGFGFIAPDGGPLMYLHTLAVERAGLTGFWPTTKSYIPTSKLAVTAANLRQTSHPAYADELEGPDAAMRPAFYV